MTKFRWNILSSFCFHQTKIVAFRLVTIYEFTKNVSSAWPTQEDGTFSNYEVSAWPTQEDGTFIFPEICPNQGERIIFGVTRASGAPAQVIWRNLLRFGIRPPWRKFASDVSAPIFCCPPLRSRGRRRSLRSGASRLRSGCAAVHARSAPSNRKCPLKRLQLTSATPASAKS